MVNPRDIDQDYVQDRFKGSFNYRVGVRKDFSAERLAEATGIPKRTVESHQDRSVGCPELYNLLKYFAVMPESFTNEILGLAGLTGAYRIEGPQVTPHEMLAHVCEIAAKLAECLEDGQIDHVEEAELAKLWPAFNAVMSKVQQSGFAKHHLHAVTVG